MAISVCEVASAIRHPIGNAMLMARAGDLGMPYPHGLRSPLLVARSTTGR
jgi:hypothetical protein